MRALEVQAVQDALRQTQGNKVAAAQLLGISRAKLYQCLL
jgi:DNA-binding NtrC family response regulator